MTALLAVAANTFRQTLRERIFYNVIIFGIGLVLLAIVVGQLTFGYPDRVVRSIGLTGVTLALDLVALLLGVALIHQEIDRKTLFVVLTRPIERWQYVTGRYLGLVMTLAIALLGFAVVFVIALNVCNGTLRNNDVIALALTLPEAALIAAVGIVISCFSTPAVGAGMGLGIWLSSATTDDLVRLTERGAEIQKLFAKVVFYVLPSLARFNFREAAIYQLPISANDVFLSVTYGMTYSAALILLASVILSRRQMI